MNAPGYISANELYRLGEAKRRLHLGRYSFLALKKAGLQIIQVGRCHYVDGAQLIELVKKIGAQKDGTLRDQV